MRWRYEWDMRHMCLFLSLRALYQVMYRYSFGLANRVFRKEMFVPGGEVFGQVRLTKRAGDL
jgi:hypothetical protein